MSKTKSNAGKKGRRNNKKQTKVDLRAGGTIAPQSMEVVLTYCTDYVTPMGITNIDDRLFRLNSIYAPHISPNTPTGHQPLGSDEYAFFYHRYRVMKCHVEVEWYGAYATGLLFGLYGSNSASAITDSGLFAEYQGSITKVMCEPAGRIKLSKTFDLPKMTGVTRAQYLADDAYQAEISANPTSTAALHVMTHCPTSSEINYAFRIKMYYTVIYFDGNDLGRS